MGGNTQGLFSGTIPAFFWEPELVYIHIKKKNITKCILIYTQFKQVSISQSGTVLPSSYHTYSDNSGFTGLYVLILQQKTQVPSAYIYFFVLVLGINFTNTIAILFTGWAYGLTIPGDTLKLQPGTKIVQPSCPYTIRRMLNSLLYTFSVWYWLEKYLNHI
jgi:hypothetical protein